MRLPSWLSCKMLVATVLKQNHVFCLGATSRGPESSANTIRRMRVCTGPGRVLYAPRQGPAVAICPRLLRWARRRRWASGANTRGSTGDGTVNFRKRVGAAVDRHRIRVGGELYPVVSDESHSDKACTSGNVPSAGPAQDRWLGRGDGLWLGCGGRGTEAEDRCSEEAGDGEATTLVRSSFGVGGSARMLVGGYA